jgi:hypothetical protein
MKAFDPNPFSKTTKTPRPTTNGKQIVKVVKPLAGYSMGTIFCVPKTLKAGLVTEFSKSLSIRELPVPQSGKVETSTLEDSNNELKRLPNCKVSSGAPQIQ